MLVEGHLDSVACSAHCDTEVGRAILHSLGGGMGEIGVIARLLGVCAEIYSLIALSGHILFEFFLQCVSGVVGCESDGFL